MRGRNKRGKKRGSGKERQRLKRKGQVESREWNMVERKKETNPNHKKGRNERGRKQKE